MKKIIKINLLLSLTEPTASASGAWRMNKTVARR